MTLTEAEWMACSDIPKMLEFLNGKVSERKLRLFACASARRLWHLLTDQRYRTAVEVVERFVDGNATRRALRSAYTHARDMIRTQARSPKDRFSAAAAASSAAFVPRRGLAHLVTHATAAQGAAYGAAFDCTAEFADLAACTVEITLLKDIFGPLPFRPITLESAVLSWNDGTVPRIAQGIYDERAFDRLPILADALLDAGCDDEDLLAHLRAPGPHVRGCWALDLILGKE